MYDDDDGYGSRYSANSGRRKTPVLGVGVGVAAVVIVLGGLFFAVADYYSTLLVWELRGSLFWIVALVIFGLLTLFAATAHPNLGWVVGILSLVGFVFYVGPVHEYQQEKQYATSIDVVRDDPATPKVNEAALPRFDERAPYTVAEAQARSNLGNYPGDIAKTSYVPNGNRYATLVKRRGEFAGYHVVLEQSIPLTGRGSTRTTCEFDEANAEDKIDGIFGNSLGREIAHVKRWWSFDGDDAYGVCVDGRPLVIVPMKKQVGGIFTVTQRFAGVAVYDGRTGQVEVVTEPDRIAALPGPTYPLSLAATQRESTHALGGLYDYMRQRVGYDTTDKGQEIDVNSGNTSEFVIGSGGRTEYLTPLTGRGSATSISSASVLRLTGKTGLAPLQVYPLDPVWLSTGAIESRIKGDFQNLPNWQNLKVLEVIPRDGKRFAATIGNDQNVLYRVEGRGDLPVGDQRALCLYLADGREVQCGSVVNVGGAGPGVAIGQAQPGTAGSLPVSVPATGEVGKLSNQDLVRLLDAVNQEAQRRLAQTGATPAPAGTGGR